MQDKDLEQLSSIVTRLSIAIGFSLVLIFITIRVVAETPVEPKEKHPSAHSQICWYVTKYYDINGELITSSAKETDCKDITPPVQEKRNTFPMSTPEAAEAMNRIFGQTAPTTTTMGTNSIIISATSTTQ